MTSTEQPVNPQEKASTDAVLYPATFAQQRLWFLDQLQPGNVAYLISWNIRLKGDLDASALERALSEIVRRHQILRTTFQVVNGEVHQRINPAATVPIPLEYLTAHPHADEEVRRLASAEAATPLDLAHGPVIRAKLLRLKEREHVLLLTLHHIFFDGSSRAVFIREFRALYEAFRAGEPSPLPEPRAQYGDYAAWQRRSVNGKRYKKLLAYWKKQLADAPAVLELPTDRPRPAVETFRGSVKAFEWPAELSSRVIAFSRSQNASLFMTLLAGFECLLSRYSGQDDIVVGVPVAGRTREELEGMIGLFANELAMRLHIPEDATFTQIATRMRETALDAYDHEDMPLDRLILEINPERSASRNPLFQVLFSMRNYHRETLQLAGLDEVEFSTGAVRTSKFDLSLFVTENEGHLSGWMEYNTDLFDEATIGRMLGHFQVFMEAAALRPETPVSQLPLLSDAERIQVLRTFNDTAVPYPRERSLHSFIEEQVERTPDAPALIFENERLSYRELNARANRLAHRLRAMGVKPGDLVAVCAVRSVELVVALLGTMKSGGAYVPLDPDYPRERLATMLEDSEPRAVLILERLADVLPAHSFPVFRLDSDWHTLAGEPDTNPAIVTTGKDRAYMIYTSGSTGKPKGVPNIHEAIVNRLLWMQSAYPLDGSDKVLQKTPYSFDVSVWEFFWPFMTGASMVVARPEGHKDPSYLVDLIAAERVTTMHFVPSMLRVFLEAEGVERCTSLRRVICSGEALPFELQERFFQRLGSELHNLYGPTEAAVDVTYYHCIPNSGRSVVPIGRPIWNTQIYVLDRHREPTPVGVAGELHIGGVGLAEGYLKRPELTAEKFIADPFSNEQGARLYKTGDLARFLPDGNIEYLGRLDFQVKLRGLRIELGEIEAALDSHAGVKQSVVVAREDEPGDKRLVAYLVINPDYKGEQQEESHEGLSTEQVDQWAAAFNEAYRQGGDAADATFNIAGWNSSYTGGPIPPEEMRVWVETTVDRILALKPERVWEIGCGTGLLLFRVAPHCREYRGTDISQTALDFVQSQVNRQKLAGVTLERRSAHEMDDAQSGRFDAVVLNSVIQYFPDLDYLTEVLKAAVAALRPGGSIFVGDVRSLPLLKMFHSSVELYKAEDSLTRGDLLRKVERDARQEGELVVDPDFFLALRRLIPQIGRVEIELKRGRMHNELTRFRYDVVLRAEAGGAAEAGVAWIDWTKAGLTPQTLRDQLAKAPRTLGLTRVPNARLWADATGLRLLEAEDGPDTAGDLRAALDQSTGAVEPEDIWKVAEEFGRWAEIRASHAATDGFCDVLLRLQDDSAPVAFPGETDLVRPLDTYATNPLRQKLAGALAPQLKVWLGTRLPDYMIPAAFVLLDSMPLSANGKVNRKALPRPEYARDESVSWVAPRTAAEERLAAIWTEVLHVRVGANDDFFALGGHSLLATQVVSRVRSAFGVEIPLRMLFESPTLAALAERIELAQQEEGRIEAITLERAPRTGRLPLSFAQQRLWFLDQLEPLNALYNMTFALRFRGELDAQALEAALNAVILRHEALRTRFVTEGGEPAQVIEENVPLTLAAHSALDEEHARELVRAEAARPFVLTEAPLVRASLIRLAPGDHVLAVITHHIVSDGWSFGVLAAELSALYEALAQKRPSPLKELPVQYVDFAVWQRGHLTAERLENQTGYWKGQLGGAPAALELPTDRPRPAVESFRGARHTVHLSEEVLENLRRFSRAEGVTPFMTLLSAFGALLARYSGQEEVVIGSPIAGRPDPRLEKLIGLFLNTIALRMRMEGDPTFRELLGRARQTAMGAYAHQDLPWEKLIETLAPARDLSRNPVFQAMLILQNTPSVEQRFGAARATPFAVNNPTSKFDVTLLASESAAGLRTTLEYNTDLFDASTAERMLEHFGNFLSAAMEHPEQRVSELPMMGAGERERLLYQLNQTTADYPRGECLHELFARQAERTPGAVAVIAGDGSLTYAELNARANQLAHGLIGRGAGPGALVGIRMSRGVNMLAGLLGILKAGAAYVPLDPSFPAERIQYILEDSGASVVLTDEVFSDAGWREFASLSAANPATQVKPDGLAYVLHTSGSTGRPKGVEITHRNLVNFLWSMRREPGFASDDTLLAVTTISFDIAALELYLPLLGGGRVVIASREEAADGAVLARMIEQREITVLQATPATWRMLVQSGWSGSGRLKALCGGEAMAPELAAQLLPLCGELWNMYGPTETTVWSSVFRVRSTPAAAAPLGRPIANTTMYVLDSRLEPVPTGVAGELYIGGDGVARGYLNRPDLTAERFLVDPFVPGARMYKTGDVVKLLASGDFLYLGRADFQVKVRGFRIELGEVETVLTQHPGVRECVAAVRDERLVGYVIPVGAAVPVAELRVWVKERLPEYMVPSVFVEMAAFPLTPNGKVDRKALPAPEAQHSAGTGEFIEPATPAEKTVAAIFAQVLKRERISADENFFDLGGHSLLAAQAISRIREAFGAELPMRALFENPTVAGLAARVSAAERAEIATPVRRLEGDGPWPLSFGQQRFWFLYQLDPLDPSYNVPYVRRLKGPLDVPALQAAVDALARRQESLRTRFVVSDGTPMQVVDAWQSRTITQVESGNEEAARAAAVEEARRPFDLEQGPLFRAVLIRIAEDDHVLVLNTHHIVSDGWSLGVMARELSAAYDAARAGEELKFEALPVRYTDYAVWQRAELNEARLAREVAWWKERLEGAPPALELPTDRPRPAIAGGNGARFVRELSPEFTAALNKMAREQGVTLFMTLLAGYAALLSRYSGQDDLVIGTPVAGRNHTETENLVGLFLNTLVLRLNTEGDPNFIQLLDRAKDAAVGAFAHQDLPFERLVQAVEPDRNMGRHPLFQTMLVLQNLPPLDPTPGGLEVSSFPVSSLTSKLDLLVTATESGDRLRLGFEYNTDLFEESTIGRMASHFEKLLGEALREPHTPVSRLPLLSPAELRLVLGDVQAPLPCYPKDLCVHELFERQAARTPGKIAVVFGAESLTYDELNRRANRLAWDLKERGIGPESLVAIWMERSLEMVVAILGALKSGAGYLPLDPVYPADRIAFMLEDAQVKVLLTQTGLMSQLPEFAGETLAVDAARSEGAADPGNPESGARPENVAYVIYTSGSTGKPKGCIVTHANVARLFTATDHWFHFTPEDTWTLFHSFAFDFSVWEIWGALLYGGRLVVVPSLIARSPEQFHQLLVEERVTVLNQTPSAFRHLIVADEQSPHSADLALRYVIFGGEALEFQTLLPWIRRHGDRPALINMYGITETTVHVTYFPVAAREVGENSVSVIGTPIPDLRVYVLDRHRQPVPPGVTGEMYVGGDGVARGYLNRPELTADRFLPDTITGREGARLYKTGDLARMLMDGNIQYLGRIDHQVKIRGFRVELGEIESALLQHPGIRECTVIDREDVPGDRRLAAYLVLRSELRPSDRELRTQLLAHLPEYMVPAAFVILPALPLTPNGKVNRRALPAPERSEAENYTAPGTAAEEVIAAIWADVLRVGRVGANDNFFEIGGHSLSATQAVARLRTAFGIHLPLRALFEAPTVSALAGFIEGMSRAGGSAPPPLLPVAREGLLPLSFAQQRLWILDRIEPDNPLYNVPVAIRMSGELNAEALQKALTAIVSRHEVLRTIYREEDDRAVQIVSGDSDFDLPVRDLSHIAAGEREREARRICDEEAGRPFRLSQDLMLRALLLKLDAEDYILFLNMHHIATDGWSLGILRREMAALYEAEVDGTAADLPAPQVQYADFAVWQREWLRDGVLAEQLAYWREQLKGAPPVLSLPVDRPRPAAQTFRGATHSFMLPAELRDGFAEFSRTHAATQFMTLLAAFKTVLLHHSGQTDLVLGTDVAGRGNVQTEGIFGFFVNLLAIRTDLSGDPAFVELVGRVRASALGAYAHQDVPFEKLVEELHPERSRSHNPLVQVLFVQNTPRTVTSMKGVEWNSFPLETRSKFDMAVFAGDKPEGIQVSWVYNPDLFDAASIELMADEFTAVLQTVVAEPAVRLSGLTALMQEIGGRRRLQKREGFEARSLAKLKQARRRPGV